MVVPNPALLHNHQVELAAQLSTMGYVLHGKLGYGSPSYPPPSIIKMQVNHVSNRTLSNLAASVNEAEKFRSRMHEWPPTNSGPASHKRGLARVMEDELGFVD